MILQKLHFENCSDFKTSFLLKSNRGKDIFVPPVYERGKNKGLQYVSFRETINPIQKRKYPYMVGGKSSATICGFRFVDNYLGWSYTDLNGYATILHSDFESFLDIFIFDAPKEKSFEVFSECIEDIKKITILK